jgi:hypothetical protein
MGLFFCCGVLNESVFKGIEVIIKKQFDGFKIVMENRLTEVENHLADRLTHWGEKSFGWSEKAFNGG